MSQDDLMALMNAPAMTPAERKRMKRRAENVARGYAYHPGTGPAGETCKTCAHCVEFRRWKKCRKAKAIWTGSRRTDILVGSPACKYWEAPTPIAAPDGGST